MSAAVKHPEQSTAYGHEDALAGLDGPQPLGEKLGLLRAALRERFPFLRRIAVTVYDAETDSVKTLADSTEGEKPLVRYEVRLSEAPSLQEILAVGRPRVVNDLSIFDGGGGEHTRRIRAAGYEASYTMPLMLNGAPWGFLFFDSSTKSAFTPDVLAELDVFGHLISALATRELAAVRMLLGALRTAIDMVHERDPGTGAHLERMARFARLIAGELAESGVHALDDEFIERVFRFAPLHDVGKIGIPDRILLKGERLTPEEFEVMKTHTERGARIIRAIVQNFGLGAFPFLDVLRSIAELHHETMDGKGYPHGLQGDRIPLEARIVAVADVFDALTSRRPYKGPWPVDEAIAALRLMAQSKLDRDCVEALARRRREVVEIQAKFSDAPAPRRASPGATSRRARSTDRA